MTNDNPTQPDNQPAGACQVQRTVRPGSEAGCDTAHKWRVRFSTPDGYYTFTDISSSSGLPMPKAAATVWGKTQVRLDPKRYAGVVSVYSIDHEA